MQRYKLDEERNGMVPASDGPWVREQDLGDFARSVADTKQHETERLRYELKRAKGEIARLEMIENVAIAADKYRVIGLDGDDDGDSLHALIVALDEWKVGRRRFSSP